MTETPSRRPSILRRPVSVFAGALLAAGAAFTAGCLERPVVEQTPTTSNVFVEQIINTAIEEIDLLFVIDNSVSMADKQALLEQAVPIMVTRLVTPDCVNEDGGRNPNDGQDCESYPDGFAPEFSPVDDIHIGVITSSLGGFGTATSCADGDSVDKSLLVPKVRAGVADPSGKGFLEWNGGDAAAVAALQTTFAEQVAAAGETGCGFEAPLEAWYRFLVDPEPPMNVVLDGTTSVSTGVDQAILAQRAEFLRPTSLVAIVVLTDENDCSAMEGGPYYANAGFGWLISDRNRKFLEPSDQCAVNPNDACCHSCLQPPPEGCDNTCGDPAPALSDEEDRANVRCFNNKERFGVDLLYPTQRYVDALSKASIVNSRQPAPNNVVPNPLLAGRQPDLVFFAGIVGVPWQDLATPETLDSPTELKYLTATQLRVPDGNNVDRWQVILGEPYLPMSAPECRAEVPHPDCGKEAVPPLDPFMIESITPRTGTNPITGTGPIAPGGSGWSDINGHEYSNEVPLNGAPANDDLQYSCIFPLDASAVKADCASDDFSCDCADEPSKGRPLCKPMPNASAQADTTQRYGKAYPATRVLRVLRDFGENSIVGSICPKIFDTNSASFGYNPAVNAIVDRLAEKLGGQCLPRELTIQENGTVPCTVVEAVLGELDCARPGRKEVTDLIRPAVLKQLEDTGRCTEDTTAAGSANRCDDYDMCQILEVADPERGLDEATANARKQQCFGPTLADSQQPGFCYIDPAKGPAAGGEGAGCTDDPSTWKSCSNQNVANCGSTERRLLRFVGEQTPAPNSITFVACVGEAATGR